MKIIWLSSVVKFFFRYEFEVVKKTSLFSFDFVILEKLTVKLKLYANSERKYRQSELFTDNRTSILNRNNINSHKNTDIIRMGG